MDGVIAVALLTAIALACINALLADSRARALEVFRRHNEANRGRE